MNPIFKAGTVSFSVTIRSDYIRVRKYERGRKKAHPSKTEREEVLRLLNFLRMLNDDETLNGVGHRYTAINYRLFNAGENT